MPIVVGGIPNPPPYAPILVAPANASYEDLAGTPTFSWTYQPAVPTNTQSAWALRRKVSGATSYLWWNVSTSAWQSTQVFNSGSTQSYTFPAASWTDGNVYNCSVATQDINGTGSYSPDNTVTAQVAPSVVVNAPGGTIATAQPTIQWTPTVPTGASQSSYRAVIYNAAQYGASGFVPGSGPSLFDTGVIGAAYVDQVETAPLLLADNLQYRVYMQITGTGGQASVWAYSAFTTSYAAPATPTLTATPTTDPTTGVPCVLLTVDAHDNLLSAVDASFETGVGAWTAGSNCTVAQSSAEALDGSHSLAMTALAGGDMTAGTGCSVDAGATYAFVASFRAAATSRSVFVRVAWLTSAGALISQISGAEVADSTTGWTQASLVAVAPSGAALASLTAHVVAPAAGEIHYVDEAGIFPGSDTTWTPGGFTGLTTTTVDYSDDGGTTWASVRNATTVALPAVSQQVEIYDYEPVPTVQRQYQAVVEAAVGSDVVVSAIATAEATIATSSWYLYDPLNPPADIAVFVTQFETSQTERSAVHYQLGQALPIVLTTTVGGSDGTVTIETITAAEYIALEALVASQHTLWLTSPLGDGYYVRLGPMPGGMSSGMGNKTRDTQFNMSTAANPVRQVQLTYLQMAKP